MDFIRKLELKLKRPRNRFTHNVRRPGSVCPNSDKIYLSVVTFRFLLLFFAYSREARLISPFRFVECPLLASRRDAEYNDSAFG